jgi:hypothetical protein
VSLELIGIGFVDDWEASFERLCETMLRGLRP